MVPLLLQSGADVNIQNLVSHDAVDKGFCKVFKAFKYSTYMFTIRIHNYTEKPRISLSENQVFWRDLLAFGIEKVSVL